MKIETPIAFGLTLTVCSVLFFYCWRIRRIRNRLNRSVQVSALPINANTGVPVSRALRFGHTRKLAKFDTHDFMKFDKKIHNCTELKSMLVLVFKGITTCASHFWQLEN